MQEKLPIKIAPSILAGDFGHLADEAKRCEDAGADQLHLDIMDGHFVPNLTMGARAIGAINRATDLFLDVHIMVYNPFDYIEKLIESGADRITFHFEATEDVEDTLNFIRKCDVQAGLAYCPETSESMIPKYLDKCDLILLMTVHPGFGGQSFIPEVLQKIEFTRNLCNQFHIREGGISIDPKTHKGALPPPFPIQVDGGIDEETARQCYQAGANYFVAGTYLFQQKEMAKAITGLKSV